MARLPGSHPTGIRIEITNWTNRNNGTDGREPSGAEMFIAFFFLPMFTQLVLGPFGPKTLAKLKSQAISNWGSLMIFTSIEQSIYNSIFFNHQSSHCTAMAATGEHLMARLMIQLKQLSSSIRFVYFYSIFICDFVAINWNYSGLPIDKQFIWSYCFVDLLPIILSFIDANPRQKYIRNFSLFDSK